MNSCKINLLSDVFTGCYQPAGPLIPMSPGWDPQKVGQPALQQLALASPGSVVQAVTCQTLITSSSSTSASQPHTNKLCEDGSQTLASSRPSAESVVAKPHKMVSPGSVEIGVGTHSADKKSSRSRSFHSSVRPSDKSRNAVANVPVGAAHLVVADQERELDLSQKGNGHVSATAVVTTHESIIKPAIGVLHDVNHATVVTCSSGVSQIGHLERFVRGLVTGGSGSPVLQPPQVLSHASSCSQTASSPHDSSKTASKRKPEQLQDDADDGTSISPKRTKYSVADEQCSSEVHKSLKDAEQSRCTDTEDREATVDNLQSSDDTSTDAAVKVNSDLDPDTNGALSLPPDIVASSLQSSEDPQIQQVTVEDVKQPMEIVESSESCELVGRDTSSNAATDSVSTSSEKIHLSSPSDESFDTERIGSPKSKDGSSGNPKKGAAAASTAESKQAASPVRSKNATELNKNRTQSSVSVQEKKSPKVSPMQAEKPSKRAADEAPTRSTSARRKRDTGGWEWYGDPERKPVYFKVT